jgi:hypothetical protein
VLHLKRALYGLRQASRAWNKRLDGSSAKRVLCSPMLILRCGFCLGMGVPCLRGFTSTMGRLQQGLQLRQMPWLSWWPACWTFVRSGSLRISWDHEAGAISISQECKALALAEPFGVRGVHKAVPMSPEVFAELRSVQDGDDMAVQLDFQRGIGSLLHLAQCTRPDIALPVGALAAFSSAPTVAHFKAMLDVVRYMGSTPGRGITFGGSQRSLGFWCDSNFAACHDTRRTTGWVATMYGGAVSWSSKKQPTTAASTMDAEYQACGAAAPEGLSLIRALGEMGLLSSDFPLQGPVVIECDNQAAISLCKDRKEGQCVKHIDIIDHFARDHVASGELSLVYFKSEDNVSDCLTKALARPLFEKGLAGLGMIVD